MKELKCPKCNSVFSVDEADYSLKNGEAKAKLAEKAVEEQALVSRKDAEMSKLKSELSSSRIYYASELQISTMPARKDR